MPNPDPVQAQQTRAARRLAPKWEVYVRWFPDGVFGLYCHECGRALTPDPATREVWRFTPSELTKMIAGHIRQKHGDWLPATGPR